MRTGESGPRAPVEVVGLPTEPGLIPDGRLTSPPGEIEAQPTALRSTCSWP